MRSVRLTWLFACAALLPGFPAVGAERLSPVVEVEEDVYRYEPADNGAGPLWCFGSTCLVRCGDQLFASGLATLPDVKPLNNCRWLLYRRTSDGWQLVRGDCAGPHARALSAGGVSRRPTCCCQTIPRWFPIRRPTAGPLDPRSCSSTRGNPHAIRSY